MTPSFTSPFAHVAPVGGCGVSGRVRQRRLPHLRDACLPLRDHRHAAAASHRPANEVQLLPQEGTNVKLAVKSGRRAAPSHSQPTPHNNCYVLALGVCPLFFVCAQKPWLVVGMHAYVSWLFRESMCARVLQVLSPKSWGCLIRLILVVHVWRGVCRSSQGGSQTGLVSCFVFSPWQVAIC